MWSLELRPASGRTFAAHELPPSPRRAYSIRNGYVFVLACVLGSVLCSAQAQVPTDSPVVIREGTIRYLTSEIGGVNRWSINVWVGDALSEDTPPMAGKTVLGEGGIVFVPRFPLRAGKDYVVVVQRDGQKLIASQVTYPVKDRTATRVKAIYPSADRLPENTLKFYVQFSAPMQKGDIYRFVELREVGGKPVELPFLEIEQEFWSRDSQRLTLLLDPGRIKRGLRPREEMGPILVQGHDYELVIDGEWPDAHGDTLGMDVIHRFTAIPPNLDQPDPATWRVTPPPVASSKHVSVQFPGPLDWAMLNHALKVQHEEAGLVEGSIIILGAETRWEFVPRLPWKPGTYRILIDDRLEDVAGNSIARPFDVDLFRRTEPVSVNDVVREFQVRPGKCD